MAANEYSLQFTSASSEKVTVANPTTLNGLSKMTVEFWVYFTTQAVNVGLVGRSNGSTQNQFTIGTGGGASSDLQVSIATAANDWFGTFATIPTILAATTWAHIAIVFDGTQTGNANRLSMYKNGIHQGTPNFTGTIPATLTSPTCDLSMAVREQTAGYLNGQLDEVRIWNTARTQAEIDTYKEWDVTGATGLLHYWKLNDGSGASTADSQGSGTGTLVNTPTWSATVPFANYAGAFDIGGGQAVWFV